MEIPLIGVSRTERLLERTPRRIQQRKYFFDLEGGTLGDFDLSLECKIESGNSGIQYRSFVKQENMTGGELVVIRLILRQVKNFRNLLWRSLSGDLVDERGQNHIIR